MHYGRRIPFIISLIPILISMYGFITQTDDKDHKLCIAANVIFTRASIYIFRTHCIGNGNYEMGVM